MKTRREFAAIQRHWIAIAEAKEDADRRLQEQTTIAKTPNILWRWSEAILRLLRRRKDGRGTRR